MSWLAVWFAALGVADLVRETGRARWSVATAALVTAALAALAGLGHPADLVALAVGVLGIAVWGELADRALLLGRWAGTGLAVLGGTGALLLLGAPLASPVSGPLRDWVGASGLFAGHDAGRLLLVVGLALVNLATGNRIVRLALLTVGALRPASADERDGPSAADELKGGRLLGPLERLLILGLGLAGATTAAGIVVAAKGLIRFPELQAKRDERSSVTGVGIDEVTEYFLIGSFVSWLVALGSLAATALG